MSKYRDRLQIIASILSIANNKAKKTQIMYQANLSYKLLCKYLNEVVDAGLVNLNEECYTLTSKGRKFLARHEEYSKRCRSLEQHLNNINNEKIALENMCFSPSATDQGSSRLRRRGAE